MCFSSVMRALVLLSALLSLGRSDAARAGDRWPAWRGADGSGVAVDGDVPREFGSQQHLAWSVDLPEPGNSTPVVWDNKVFLTQPLAGQQKRVLICLDLRNGEKLWEAAVSYEQQDEEKTHRTNPFCSASPVTDGRRVIVWYGSAGLYCYDMDGQMLWERDLGRQTHQWGYGSSPVIHGDLCFLNFGPGEKEFVLAVNKTSGKTAWKQPVPQADPQSPVAQEDRRNGGIVGQGLLRGSWATPLVITASATQDQREELIVPLPGRVVAYDPQTGKQLWFCRGLGGLVYSSPMVGETTGGQQVVVCLGGYRSASLGVKPGGSGDVTDTHRLWRTKTSKLRLGTGVMHKGYLYVTDMKGVAGCLDPATGKVLWEQRLAQTGSDTWSSLTLVGRTLFLPNKSGDVFAFRASPEDCEILAENTLREPTNSSLVPVGDALLLRTHQRLYCFGTSQ